RGCGGAASIPAEVMKFVMVVRSVNAANLLAKTFRSGVNVECHKPVRLLPARVECDHVSERFDGCFRRQAWRRIEGLIGSEKSGCHVLLLSSAQGAEDGSIEGQVASLGASPQSWRPNRYRCSADPRCVGGPG